MRLGLGFEFFQFVLCRNERLRPSRLGRGWRGLRCCLRLGFELNFLFVCRFFLRGEGREIERLFPERLDRRGGLRRGLGFCLDFRFDFQFWFNRERL